MTDGSLSRRVAIAVLTAIAPTGALAASFDCGPGNDRIERVICSNRTLSAADTAMAAVFAGNLALVSPTGAAALRNGQRQWLRARAAACPDATIDCLKVFYDDRRAQLGRAVQRKGGLKFYASERFAVSPSPPDDTTRNPVVQDVVWPQIDRPGTDDQRAWNAAEAAGAREATPTDSEDTDLSNHYVVSEVTARLISVARTSTFYVHGAAHDGVGISVDTRLLAERRPLAPPDLFDPAKPWADTLVRLARADLLAQHPDGPDADPPGEERVRPAVIDPTRWRLGPAGLVIVFEEYEVASYAAGLPEATIPWPALAPIMALEPVYRP